MRFAIIVDLLPVFNALPKKFSHLPEAMEYQVVTLKPEWGVNYDLGYIGFSFYQEAFVSKGIAFFTRWERKTLPVSHTFVVSGQNECIEAQPSGVKRAPLLTYFDDPTCLVFFRKPRCWTPQMGQMIVNNAEKHLGHGYGFGLLIANALGNMLAGRLVRAVTRGWSHRLVCWALDSKKQEICSELVALALKDTDDLAGKGCLRRPANTITPQLLFEDDVVFEAWKASL